MLDGLGLISFNCGSVYALFPSLPGLTRSKGSVNLPQCFVGLPWFERIFKDFQGIKEIIYLGQKNNFIKVAKHKFTKTAKQKITKLTTK